jgi:hypothetical protein
MYKFLLRGDKTRVCFEGLLKAPIAAEASEIR